MSGWRWKWHYQRLSTRSLGFSVGHGRGAGWRTFYFLGTFGRQYLSIHVSKNG